MGDGSCVPPGVVEEEREKRIPFIDLSRLGAVLDAPLIAQQDD